MHTFPVGTIMEASFFRAGNTRSPLAPFCYLMVENHHKRCCLLFNSHIMTKRPFQIL